MCRTDQTNGNDFEREQRIPNRGRVAARIEKGEERAIHVAGVELISMLHRTW